MKIEIKPDSIIKIKIKKEKIKLNLIIKKKIIISLKKFKVGGIEILNIIEIKNIHKNNFL